MLFSERVFCGQLTPDDTGREVLLAGAENPNIETGTIEVMVKELTMLAAFLKRISIANYP